MATVAVSPDANLAANAAVIFRLGFIVQDLALAGAATDGPISAPYRDWFGLAFSVFQQSAAGAGGVVTTAVGRPLDMWEFRSKRRLRDLTDGVFAVAEASAAVHWSMSGRMLVTIP